MKTPLRIVPLSLILSALSPAPGVLGADFTWSGSDSSFSSASNWGGTAPTPSTTNTFTFSGSPTSLTPTIATSYATSSMTFASGAGAFTIGSSTGSTAENFKFSGGAGTNLITQNSANAQTINATVKLSANTLTVAGSGAGNLALNSILFDSTAAATNTITISATNATLGSAAWTGAVGATTLTLSTNGSLTFTGASYQGLTLLNVSPSSNNFTISATNPSGFSSNTNFTYHCSTTLSGTAAIALTGNIQMAATSQRGLIFSNTAGVTLGSAGSTIGIGSSNNSNLTGGSGVQFSVANGCTATLAGNVTKLNSNGVNSTGTTGMYLTNSTGGTLILTGNNSWDGGVTLQSTGGTIQIGNGGTTGNLGTGGVTFNGSTNTAALVYNRSNTLIDNNNITGYGYVKQIGAGTTILSGSNSYTRSTTIANGVLQFANRLALYSGSTANWTASQLIVNSGATLAVNAGGTGEFTQNDLDTIKSIGTSTGGFTNGSFLGIDTTNATAPFVYSSNIANTNGGTNVLGLTKLGSGTLGLTGNNTYTGATKVAGGELDVNGSLAAGSTVSVTGATLGGSGVIHGAVNIADGTINGNSLTTGGVVLTGSSKLSGYNIASSVTVNSGTTALTGTTQSTSALSVSAGATLNANGTIAGSASVSGLLSGTTTVTGNLALTSGTLSPGNSPGITTVEGNFTMDKYSTLVAQVTGTVAGTSYDQVKVSGDVSLAGTLDLSSLSGLTLGDTITLINSTGSGTTTGYFSTIITSGSTYTVTSNSNYMFTSGTTEYLLNFASNADGGTNFNDVTLTVVPEPSTWAMMIGGIGALGIFRRLRSRYE